MQRLVRTSLAAAGIALLATLAFAQTGKQPPEMTPEQKAEMEAYAKAGTPGPQHQAMAASAGTYDLKVSVPDGEINLERVPTARSF